jgi:hypothetical protein
VCQTLLTHLKFPEKALNEMITKEATAEKNRTLRMKAKSSTSLGSNFFCISRRKPYL